MQPRLMVINRTVLTLTALFIGCITSAILVVHIESTHSCNDDERHHMLARAMAHTAGTPRSVLCEGNTLMMLYTHGETRHMQVLVVRYRLNIFQVLYASEPHLHTDILSDTNV